MSAIHLSGSYNPPHPVQNYGVGAGLISSITGQGAWHTQVRLPVHHSAEQKQIRLKTGMFMGADVSVLKTVFQRLFHRNHWDTLLKHEKTLSSLVAYRCSYMALTTGYLVFWPKVVLLLFCISELIRLSRNT